MRSTTNSRPSAWVAGGVDCSPKALPVLRCKSDLNRSFDNQPMDDVSPPEPLDDNAYYTVSGRALNVLYSDSMQHLNDAPSAYEYNLPFSYSESYWSGFASAVNGVRTIVRDFKTNDTNS